MLLLASVMSREEFWQAAALAAFALGTLDERGAALVADELLRQLDERFDRSPSSREAK